MRILASLFIGLSFTVPALQSQEQEVASGRDGRATVCTNEKNPRYHCDVHGISFEAIRVPISYGFPAGEVPSLGVHEFHCRYRVAREEEFPNPAPREVNGGCIVGEKEFAVRCACPECTAVEADWREAYRRRQDVPHYVPMGPPAAEGSDPDTELYLRIQELLAFGETEVARCLEERWEFYYNRR
jgi:hypothetical protein